MSTIDQANEVLEREGVKWVQVQFTDILGKVRCVFVPAAKFLKGHAWESGVTFAAQSALSFVADLSFICSHPDPKTLIVLPFANEGGEKTALITCNIRDARTKEYFQGDPTQDTFYRGGAKYR